jgi:2-polyprenyl-6-methoxyphenol hydroxylase-like FAD-dependent oxidoreductase
VCTILYPELDAKLQESKATAPHDHPVSLEAYVHPSTMTAPAADRSRGDHAIVLGASMAGLLAARALADHYRRVTLVERDIFPETDAPRKGVPQGHHVHALLTRGVEVIEELFPGLIAELVAAGALVSDTTGSVRWFLAGGYQCQPTSGLKNLQVSRPRLERHVRRRLLALPNIRAMEGCDVVGLEMDAVGGRVAGVRVRRGADADAALFPADLVVDATGRGSRLPKWLATLGYAPPTEERVEIRLGYATRVYRRAGAPEPGARAVVGTPAPGSTRGGILQAIEGDRWLVLLAGYLGDYPPVDEAGFRAFAASLPTPEIAALVSHGEPLGEAVSYRFLASQRRRYERLASFPEGLLAIGDALCSFDPAYGQGMAVAAQEARALGECLAAGTDRLASRFFVRAARIVDTPWRIAVGGDLRYPEVEGPRGPMVRFINWYLGWLHRAAWRDPELAIAFQRVANLMAEPSSLLRPRIAWRLLLGNLRPSSSPAAARATATNVQATS